MMKMFSPSAIFTHNMIPPDIKSMMQGVPRFHLETPYLSKQKALFVFKEWYHAPPLTGGGLSNQGQNTKICLNFQQIVFFFHQKNQT
jgi:hypothetical protein